MSYILFKILPIRNIKLFLLVESFTADSLFAQSRQQYTLIKMHIFLCIYISNFKTNGLKQTLNQ